MKSTVAIGFRRRVMAKQGSTCEIFRLGCTHKFKNPWISVDSLVQTAKRRPKRLFSFHGIALNLHGIALKLHGIARFLHGSIFRLSPLFFFFL